MSHASPADRAEGIVWADAVRLRAITMADRLRKYPHHRHGPAMQCPLCEAAELLLAIARAEGEPR